MSHLRTIVLVGHCGPDRQLLHAAVQRAVPGASVARADEMSDLEPHLSNQSLLLINRVLDDGFESPSGIDLIRRVLARPNPPAIMLISNLPDAQAEATAAGAWPGFGKAQWLSESTCSRLREAAKFIPASSTPA